MNIKNLFMALAAVVAMLMVGCSKDKELAGTQWKFETEVDVTRMVEEDFERNMELYERLLELGGGKIMMNLLLVVNFTNETSGTTVMDVEVPVFSLIPGMEDGFSESSDFTYTFDGENGTLNEDGDIQKFTYNKKDNTIALHIGDEELAELLGYSVAVFKEVK